ncbi:hypothetical protein Ndes2526B_g04933 [Nannochloris sp. 'desiccata']
MEVFPTRQTAAVLRCSRAYNHHHAFVTSSNSAPGKKEASSRKVTNHSLPSIRSLRTNTRASAASPPDIGSSSPSTSSAPPKKRLAVFVSGGGSNFKAIHAAILDGTFDADVAAVVTNAPSCKGALYAQEHGIPVLVHPPPKTDPSTGLGADELTDALVNAYTVDFIILAGYMKLVPAALVRTYHHAILNIHPGLLPSFGGKGFYGSRVHQAVIQSGARFSGPTVHFIDEEYDTGPILAQAVVPVLPTDSVDGLAARVLKEEHRLYPGCVAALCEGRITWRDDGIPIMWSAH